MDPLAVDDPRRIGPFRLVARLGRGGMGKVYLGRSDATGRSVAVKTIHSELAADREFRIRFSREVAAARRVRDEYIAEVVDADPEGPIPWLATAYVPGISVDDAVRRFGPLPEDSVRVLGVCIGRAVAAIHAVGLVHRDLKPGNVLLTATGPKVIDFGIARGESEDGLTRTGMVSGSPPYMAPEQLLTGGFGPGSDVFALGAILHFAAVAAGPYGRGGAQEQYARALAVGPAVDEALPLRLRGPVTAAFAADPAARPGAAQFAASLQDAPGEKPAAGWLPGAVAQEILIQATDALNTASADNAPLPAPPYAAPAQSGPPPSYGPGPGMYASGGRPGPVAPAGPGTPPGAVGVVGGTPPGGSHPGTPPGAVPLQPHPSFPPNPVARPQMPPMQNPGTRPGQYQIPSMPPPGQHRPPMPQPMPQSMPPQPMPPQQVRPPYGPPGYATPLPAPVGDNSVALTGFVLSLVSIIMPCLLPAGLICGLIGLNKAGPAGVRRGQAMAAVVISTLLIVGWVILIAVAAGNANNGTS